MVIQCRMCGYARMIKIKIEAPLDRYLRIETSEGDHLLKVILKSTKEIQSRFLHLLVGKISFKGYDADASAKLPFDDRKTIEFVGDSITEGVLVMNLCGLRSGKSRIIDPIRMMLPHNA